MLPPVAVFVSSMVAPFNCTIKTLSPIEKADASITTILFIQAGFVSQVPQPGLLILITAS